MSNNSNDHLPCPYCALRSAHVERTHAGHRLHCELCGWDTPVNHEQESTDYVHVDPGEVDLNGAFGCPGCRTRSAYLRGGNRSERIRVQCADPSCGWTGTIGEAHRLFQDALDEARLSIN